MCLVRSVVQEMLVLVYVCEGRCPNSLQASSDPFLCTGIDSLPSLFKTTSRLSGGWDVGVKVFSSFCVARALWHLSKDKTFHTCFS